MSTGKTAVLFFSRTLNDEYVANSLQLERQRFSKLYQFLVKKTLRTVEASGLSLIEVYSDQQVGNSFGERLANSIQTVSEKGFDKVIIIGNDAPELSVDNLRLADKALNEGQQVLGSDIRGGVYLIGVDLQQINADQLACISWHSNKVFDELSTFLGHFRKLSTKSDVNSLADLSLLLNVRSTLSQGVRAFLKSVLSSWGKVIKKIIGISFSIGNTQVNRGPPILA